MRLYPHLYEINANIFLRRLSQKYGRALTLATIPDEEWQVLAGLGFDMVWLMGVWTRSPAARREALLYPSLRPAYDQTLPGWTDKDIAGSPYAVYDYHLDPQLGKPGDLARLKKGLNRQGLRLVLDFVTNHLALDHPWISSHPERFVRGTGDDVRTHADWFFSPVKDVYLAHGRDPYFPPWTDTAQFNFYADDLRQALINELLSIAEVADGVRCDMAMLALNDVFARVWGQTVKGYPRPEREFWSEAIGRLKQMRPDFLFVAEAYWGLEGQLQQLGFDFTYDKTLYDRLLAPTVSDIRQHLMAAQSYQEHSVRFIENHDERRAVTAFGGERSLAAASIIATLPGLRFFHDGQLEGRRIRLPIQMIREPEEATDTNIRQFYHHLLAVSNAPDFHDGRWQLLEVSPAHQNDNSHQNLLAWSWLYNGQRKIVTFNYSAGISRGQLQIPVPAKIKGQETLCGQATAPLDLIDGRRLNIAHGPWTAIIVDII